MHYRVIGMQQQGLCWPLESSGGGWKWWEERRVLSYRAHSLQQWMLLMWMLLLEKQAAVWAPLLEPHSLLTPVPWCRAGPPIGKPLAGHHFTSCRLPPLPDILLGAAWPPRAPMTEQGQCTAALPWQTPGRRGPYWHSLSSTPWASGPPAPS